SPGNYTPKMTVTDTTPLSTTASGNVSVVGNPSASFTVSPTSPAPNVNDMVTFIASASDPADPKATFSYSWNFGDGTGGGPGPSTSHQYSSAGDFTVGL